MSCFQLGTTGIKLLVKVQSLPIGRSLDGSE